MGATTVKKCVRKSHWCKIRGVLLSLTFALRGMTDIYLMKSSVWCLNAWDDWWVHPRQRDGIALQFIPFFTRGGGIKRGERKEGSRTDRRFSENNKMNGVGREEGIIVWPTAFDRLVQSGEQMVFLEQSSNFSVCMPILPASVVCFPFLKLNLQSLWVTVDSCSPAGPASNSRRSGCLQRMEKLFVDYSLGNMATLSVRLCGLHRGEQTDEQPKV